MHFQGPLSVKIGTLQNHLDFLQGNTDFSEKQNLLQSLQLSICIKAIPIFIRQSLEKSSVSSDKKKPPISRQRE